MSIFIGVALFLSLVANLYFVALIAVPDGIAVIDKDLPSIGIQFNDYDDLCTATRGYVILAIKTRPKMETDERSSNDQRRIAKSNRQGH